LFSSSTEGIRNLAVLYMQIRGVELNLYSTGIVGSRGIAVLYRH